jgi:hypothetical protein
MRRYCCFARVNKHVSSRQALCATSSFISFAALDRASYACRRRHAIFLWRIYNVLHALTPAAADVLFAIEIWCVWRGALAACA